ncbi:hypothetical protein TMatcc_007793 [Talaromyces marneffei ATCC 18224]
MDSSRGIVLFLPSHSFILFYCISLEVSASAWCAAYDSSDTLRSDVCICNNTSMARGLLDFGGLRWLVPKNQTLTDVFNPTYIRKGSMKEYREREQKKKRHETKASEISFTRDLLPAMTDDQTN